MISFVPTRLFDIDFPNRIRGVLFQPRLNAMVQDLSKGHCMLRGHDHANLLFTYVTAGIAFYNLKKQKPEIKRRASYFNVI